MKKINKTYIIILLVLNVVLSTRLWTVQKKFNNTVNSLYIIKKSNHNYLKKMYDYSQIINTSLSNEIRVVDKSQKLYLLNNIIKNYKMVIFFPKKACRDCLTNVFNDIKVDLTICNDSILLLSDFYSTNELKLYKDEYGLSNFDLYFLESTSLLHSIKEPVIFLPQNNNLLFVYDIQHKNIFKEIIN